MQYRLWVENIENLPAVEFAIEPSSGNFIDRTNDLVAWDVYAKQVLDLDRYRFFMKPIFYNIVGQQLENWGSVSNEIRVIGAKYFFVPYQLRLTVVTEEQDYENWENLLIETQGTPTEKYVGRAKIFDEMRRCVAHYVRRELMTMQDSQNMLKDVGMMSDWYIRANAQDLIKWILNEPPYENDGFQQKPYFNANLKEDLKNIYNGFY